jgi:hypothetical protein
MVQWDIISIDLEEKLSLKGMQSAGDCQPIAILLKLIVLLVLL